MIKQVVVEVASTLGVLSLISSFELPEVSAFLLVTPAKSKATATISKQYFFIFLNYNFKTQRAFVESAYSQYGEGFILSQQIKRNKDNTIFGFKNIYTTCNQEVPHFGIAAKKVKIIPNKIWEGL